MQIFKNYAAYLQMVSRVYEWSEWKCNARFRIDKAVNAVADQVSLTDLSMRRPSVLFESRIFLCRNRILRPQQFMLWSFNLPNLISHPLVFFWKRILFETFWQIMQTKNAQFRSIYTLKNFRPSLFPDGGLLLWQALFLTNREIWTFRYISKPNRYIVS